MIWPAAMIVLLLVAPAFPGRAATRATRAAALYAHAESLLARRTIDTRRGALREL